MKMKNDNMPIPINQKDKILYCQNSDPEGITVLYRFPEYNNIPVTPIIPKMSYSSKFIESSNIDNPIKDKKTV